MKQPAPVDLIHLVGSDGSRCVVRVTGRSLPGVLTDHDILHADVLASMSSVDARLDLYLLPHDLDSWGQDLSGLHPGRTIGIGGDRGPGLDIRMHDDGRLSVRISDPDSLTVVLRTRPEGDWIAEHLRRLELVRLTWPSEVVETSPGAYEWSPDRRR
ncbi:DUF5959 family protein [Streptomyces sp. NPDC048301]|uniref:DUF5959 family protein n=1 Tax=unclassified Streptomyces TaxID=2593676 RepID=UPI00342E5850